MRHRRIENVMTSDVVTVVAETPFKEIVRLMDQAGVSGVPVVDAERHVLGVVSQSDLLAKQRAQEPDGSRPPLAWLRRRDTDPLGAELACELMSAPARTVAASATVVEAARLLDRHGIKRLPVVDGHDVLVGIVSRRDLLRVFLRTDADIAEEVTHEVFERDLDIAVDPATVIVRVLHGVVDLGGQVDRRSTVAVAEALIRRVDGVVDVHNRLRYARDDTHQHLPDGMAVDITHESRPDRYR